MVFYYIRKQEMKDLLCAEYPKRLRSMFAMVNKHMTEKAFGGKKALIGLTIPFMVLEKWRENGHANEIPLLDEAVKNVVLATAATIFGWEKTCCLHLRVALENVYYGIFLLGNPSLFSKFRRTGEVQYQRFSALQAQYVNTNSITMKASKSLNISTTTLALYDALSKWTHTLGNDFVSDLSLLGYLKLENATLGRLKGYFANLSRVCCVAYLTIRPEIFHDIGAAEQRLFLQPLEISERKRLRGLIGI
jgi:hypothetical protein